MRSISRSTSRSGQWKCPACSSITLNTWSTEARRNHGVDRSVEQAFIHDWAVQSGTGDAQELNVGARKVVPRVLPQDQYPAHRGPRVVGRRKHLHAREPLDGAAVVLLQRGRIDRPRQVFILEVAQIQVSEPRSRGRMGVE